MASIVDRCNDTGSPSMSRTEDNLSNSEGPLLKRSVGKSNTTESSENLTGMKSDLLHRPSTFACQEESISACENTKKRYCLWGLTFLLGIVGLCNLLLSITIITVLRVSRGMEAMEIIPEAKLIKFYGQTDLDKVCIYENICQGYGDEPVELVGDASNVLFTVKNRHLDDARSNFRLLQNGTGFSLVESFEVQDSRTGNTFFSTNFPNFGLPSGVRKLAVNLAETHRIVSPVNLSLVFESNRQITIHGAESTTMDGKIIIWMADNDMHIRSNHSIILNGKKGMFFDVMRMPLAPVYERNDEKKFLQYKICVCMPQGKLFRVPVLPGSHVKVNCARIATSPEHNPCQ